MILNVLAELKRSLLTCFTSVIRFIGHVSPPLIVDRPRTKSVQGDLAPKKNPAEAGSSALGIATVNVDLRPADRHPADHPGRASAARPAGRAVAADQAAVAVGPAFDRHLAGRHLAHLD